MNNNLTVKDIVRVINGELINGTIVSKAAATYTPSSTTQTIPSGVYLAGAQTISAIPNASGVDF